MDYGLAQLVSLTLVHWIVIYPVDTAIQLLNNWRQVYRLRRQINTGKNGLRTCNLICNFHCAYQKYCQY